MTTSRVALFAAAFVLVSALGLLGPDSLQRVGAILTLVLFVACLVYFVKLFDPAAYLRMRRYSKRRAAEVRQELRRGGGGDPLDAFVREVVAEEPRR